MIKQLALLSTLYQDVVFLAIFKIVDLAFKKKGSILKNDSIVTARSNRRLLLLLLVLILLGDSYNIL